MDRREKYKKFLTIFIEAHPSLIKLDQYKKAQELWNTLKEDNEKLNTKIMRQKSRASEMKSRHIKSFLVKSKRKSSPQTESRENPPNLEEEEAIETVAIPHDDENENETRGLLKHNYTFFFINNQKFKQSPQKSLICQTISKQFAGANKR